MGSDEKFCLVNGERRRRSSQIRSPALRALDGHAFRELREVRRYLLTALALFTSAPVQAKGDSVALTFDDLPTMTLLHAQSYANYTNAKLLRGLHRHHLPAIGFVNEGKLDDLERAAQIDILRQWLDAGMSLGNHTFSHESPNKLLADGYIRDIARGEQVTRPMLVARHRDLRWFRHPYLETGMPLETKLKIDNWLASRGYRIAPVTMENSDWLFSEPYDDAIARHDKRRVQRIKAAYLTYTAKIIPWYREAGHQLLGRGMAFVMLLHDTRLNADCIDNLSALLRKNKLRPVTLEQAMADPAYRIADPYVGADGIEWLERWSQQLHKELPWNSFKDPPADIDAEYKAVDHDRERRQM
ncbi:MAG: polysaccharide deacetylase [Sphingomonadales bacterium]|nr:polysaccharide deacetylase [Sphingomonadales bacterium]